MQYKKMNKDDIAEALADLSKLPLPEAKRPYTVLTGARGADMFDKAMRRDALRMLLQSVEKRGLVDKQEYRGIEEMINSNDWRDQELAAIILETKNKENVPQNR